MKTTIKSTLSVLLALVFIVTLASCRTAAPTDVWENATYREDMEFGSGANTVVVEIQVQEHEVTFTIKTDKQTVGEALLEHGLIAGEQSQYGMYVKQVNGMTADYDVDQSYWAFYVDGELATTGVDTTEITQGATYQLVYTKN